MKQIIDRIVNETLNSIRKPNGKLVEGVQYDSRSNSFTFDFTQDSEHDIIKLTNHGLFQSSIYNKCFYFKYQFEDDVDSSVRANFIEYIKFHENMDNGDVSAFIEKAVNSLDDTINIREYDTVVYPQSISEINRKVISYIRLFGYPDFLTFELVKEAFNKLTQPKVLVIDDVMTSGATLSYIINTIYKVNPNATVVVFTLIGK